MKKWPVLLLGGAIPRTITQLVRNLRLQSYRLHLLFWTNCQPFLAGISTLSDLYVETYFAPIKSTSLVSKWRIRTFAPYFDIRVV